MRKLLTISIPLVLGVGLLTAALHKPEERSLEARQSGAVTNTTLPAVIEGGIVEETTTTTMAPAPEPPPPPEPTTTTTMAPVTTTTTAPRPQPTAPATFRPPPPPRPPTTTTTMAPAPPPAQSPPATSAAVDCGSGSASVKAQVLGKHGDYQLAAIVSNQTTKAIQLEALTVRAIHDGVERFFKAEVGGRVVDSGAEMSFAIPESQNTTYPTEFEIVEFRFHTAGLPECTSS